MLKTVLESMSMVFLFDSRSNVNEDIHKACVLYREIYPAREKLVSFKIFMRT